MNHAPAYWIVAIVVSLAAGLLTVMAVRSIWIYIEDRVTVRKQERARWLHPSVGPVEFALRPYPWWTNVWGIRQIYFAGWVRGDEYGFARGLRHAELNSPESLKAATMMIEQYEEAMTAQFIVKPPQPVPTPEDTLNAILEARDKMREEYRGKYDPKTG